MTQRATPNPTSRLLKHAIIGGAGIGQMHELSVPPLGMGAVLLYVPLDEVLGLTLPDIQSDVGLPWFVEGGPPMWFASEPGPAFSESSSTPVEGDQAVIDDDTPLPDLQAAAAHVEQAASSADFHVGSAPAWYGWALQEAFLAGIHYKAGNL